MRKLEQKMVDAVDSAYPAKCGNNTEVYIMSNPSCIVVLLWGNMIYTKDIETNVEEFSLAGWNTPTTRSRLRALGVNITYKKGIAYYKGASITNRQWVRK